MLNLTVNARVTVVVTPVVTTTFGALKLAASKLLQHLAPKENPVTQQAIMPKPSQSFDRLFHVLDQLPTGWLSGVAKKLNTNLLSLVMFLMSHPSALLQLGTDAAAAIAASATPAIAATLWAKAAADLIADWNASQTPAMPMP